MLIRWKDSSEPVTGMGARTSHSGKLPPLPLGLEVGLARESLPGLLLTLRRPPRNSDSVDSSQARLHSYTGIGETDGPA